MDFSKKVYILIGVLILVVLILFLVGIFTKEKSPLVSFCPEQITYQEVVYNTVKINGQCWLAENLRAFSYRDGTAIPKLTGSDDWDKDREGACTCYYDQEKYCDDYGALYNWYAVNNEKGICPEGWNVLTDEQWTVGDYDFKAVFGGFRNSAGPYSFLNQKGFWWTAMPSEDFAFARVVDKDSGEMRRIESSKFSGFSVRCIKN